MIIGYDMDVIPEHVIEDMHHTMIKPHEHMARGVSLVGEHDASRRLFFPAIGARVADEEIPLHLKRAIGIERHSVGLSERPPGVAEICLWDTATRRGGRW